MKLLAPGPAARTNYTRENRLFWILITLFQDSEVLRDYIAYARTFINPRLSDEAGQKLIQTYVRKQPPNFNVTLFDFAYCQQSRGVQTFLRKAFVNKFSRALSNISYTRRNLYFPTLSPPLHYAVTECGLIYELVADTNKVPVHNFNAPNYQR